MSPRAVVVLAGVVLLLLFAWLRSGPEDRIVGVWAVDEAAWAAADPALEDADADAREAALNPPRRSPLFVRFGPGPAFALSMQGEIRRGRYLVEAVDGDRVTLLAAVDGVERRLSAKVGWGRCLLDVGFGRPLPMFEVR